LLEVVVVVVAVDVVDDERRDDYYLRTMQLLPKAVARPRIFGPLVLPMTTMVVTLLLILNSLSFLVLRCS